MVESRILRSAFHLVDQRTLWSSARKPFWPASHGGRVIHVSEFQNMLKEQRDKILVARRLISDPANGIRSSTFLGEKLLAEIDLNQQLANYLYLQQGIIHPRFFAEALHLIATHSKALAPHLAKTQLRSLGRERLSRSLDSGAVNTLEIGKEFERFSRQTPQQRLELLARLGVLQLKTGATIADVLRRPEPATVPAAAQRLPEKAQLDLFFPPQPKKTT